MGRMVRATAPTRMCDIGRWSDTHWAEYGAVCSIAIDRLAHVVIEELEIVSQTVSEFGYRVTKPPSSSIVITAPDLEVERRVVVGQRDYSGPTALLEAAVHLMGMQGTYQMMVWADAPPACGVGSSASVTVAVIAALAKIKRLELTPHQIAEMAQRVEVEELGLECGVQDQFAAAYGGINLMHITYPDAVVIAPRVALDTLKELEERMHLVYLGPRSSSDMHHKVIERYRSGCPIVRGAVQRLRELPGEFVTALSGNQLLRVAELINENWLMSNRLCFEVSNPLIDELHLRAFQAGAIAACANGAGGGGSTVIMSAPGKEVAVRRAIHNYLATAGPQNGVVPALMSFRFATQGVMAWEVRK